MVILVRIRWFIKIELNVINILSENNKTQLDYIMKLKLFIALSLLLSTNVFSQQADSGVGKITSLYMPVKSNFIRINFNQTIKNPSNCGKAEFYVVELTDGAGSARFTSMLLTAFTSNKPVRFWVRGCSEGQYWGATRPTIYDIYIYE